jgi:hypothetical protein
MLLSQATVKTDRPYHPSSYRKSTNVIVFITLELKMKIAGLENVFCNRLKRFRG